MISKSRIFVVVVEKRYQDVKQRNADKLDDLNNQIDKLKAANGNYSSDLDYWDRVTRSQLETEIQTYRSILNYQTKILQDANNSAATSGKQQTKPVTSSSSSAATSDQNLSAEERQKRERIAGNEMDQVSNL